MFALPQVARRGGVALASLALAISLFGAPRPAAAQHPLDDAEAISHASSLSRAFRNAAETLLPAVVEIRTEVKPRAQARGQGRQNPFEGTPFERFFDEFGQGKGFGMQEGPRAGLGTGVIVDKSGIILTNNHVVADADVVIVTLNDGREFKTTEIKTDPRTDLAVLRIAGAGTLTEARLGDSDKLEIGDWVIAIGNPFGLESTVSAGIISGKGRQLESNERAKFLQTDAAINPGNSGGPLANLYGEVVGINTAIASSSGSYQGVGFAIPVNQARWVMQQLIEKGTVQRAYLGVAIRPLSRELAEAFSIDQREGALVAEVYPNTPAAQAGFEVGDVIVKFNDEPIRNPSELIERVERVPLGTTQQVTIVRKGQSLALNVEVKSLPNDFGLAGRSRRLPGDDQGDSDQETLSNADLGLTVANLAEDEARQLGFEGHAGVLISKVAPNSPAAEARLRPGMLVMKVGRKQTTVANVGEFERAVAQESLDNGVLLLVRNPNGGQDFVLLKR